ncbi:MULTISPECIES: SLATT domain-containing protein [unclassified Pseudoalteromonas]|uniref:SLATT domain-containing protein n=1 Tax=unclassified Pseudoalteromonas TaxID=194690 RepID=UPI0030155CF3
MAFSDNVWWTRKARIQAEKRLLSNAFQSQLLLLWYSFFGVAVSIYYLEFTPSAGQEDLAGISWIVYSVLVLSMSGFIAGLSFKERASLIKESYETLKTFYHKAKEENADIGKISAEYEQIMGLCENHTDYDYYLALCLEHVTSNKSVDTNTGCKTGLDRCPTWYHWFSITWWLVKRYVLLTCLYILPVILLVAIEKLA